VQSESYPRRTPLDNHSATSDQNGGDELSTSLTRRLSTSDIPNQDFILAFDDPNSQASADKPESWREKKVDTQHHTIFPIESMSQAIYQGM
jgi:hypothetical protein